MTKKLLLLCALFVMCVGRISAQSEENVWHIATDTYQYIPMNEVSYLLFVDDDVLFSIVKTKGEIVTDVSHVYFRNVPLAVEGVESEKIDLSVFPNPVVSQLTLQGLRANTTLKVLSLDGATLIDTVVGPNNNSVNVSSLAAGVYLLQVNETTVKFIKK